MQTEAWQQKVTQKREFINSLIPSEWRIPYIPPPADHPNVLTLPHDILLQDETLITESAPLDILTNIANSTWTAEEVTRAFCHRAAIAHQLVNCLTEIDFDRAIATAKALDKLKAETGQVKGPLHGLPVSFMDRYRVEGLETSAGFVSWLGKVETSSTESPLVSRMRKLGAIPFCKTNMPQSMLLGATANNVTGSTLNPYNRLLSAGGGAGGEGALLSLHASPLALATELGGTARLPSTFANLYSLKPSTGRLSAHRIAGLSQPLPIVRTTPSIMSRDLHTITELCHLLFGDPDPAFRIDPDWLDIPWRNDRIERLSTRHPTFAVLRSDRFVQPQVPVQRALRTVVDALESYGYHVITWDPPAHPPAIQNFFAMVLADGGEEVRSQIKASGEPPVPQLAGWFAKSENEQPISVREYWKLGRARLEYIAAYNAYWESTAALTMTGEPVSGVILPVAADAACLENKLSYFGYSAIANYLDYSAVSFPVTSVDCNLDPINPNMRFLNAQDKLVQSFYDPELFHGSPVGLQVMCRRLEEETALGLAEIITRACQSRQS